MNAALKGTDRDDFSPYEPMGTAAYANSGGGSSYGEPPTTATNSPDGNNGDNGNNGDKKKDKKKDKKQEDNSDNAFLIPPSDLGRLGRTPFTVG
jgi:hypothetical protein